MQTNYDPSLIDYFISSGESRICSGISLKAILVLFDAYSFVSIVRCGSWPVSLFFSWKVQENSTKSSNWIFDNRLPQGFTYFLLSLIYFPCYMHYHHNMYIYTRRYVIRALDKYLNRNLLIILQILPIMLCRTAQIFSITLNLYVTVPMF